MALGFCSIDPVNPELYIFSRDSPRTRTSPSPAPQPRSPPSPPRTRRVSTSRAPSSPQTSCCGGIQS
ncbi:hypothetical protein M430DRAFT_182235 [Amorphotheca resinae ATCC 22711]|uniref:Uncharacterized protein n=1 Tax=Amorphotheca resinae ATCC 22711 TaxID=857342 RepID=A0A2T3ARR3_AMORE|nr:hypothetical protein M430DRAFT_182235 [Amorphotheca resinae ATCC 22711]PSS09043.1 hypothetical protein M430DRAFT_182235 [Amorphotheca resinae ATCC 22711]